MGMFLAGAIAVSQAFLCRNALSSSDLSVSISELALASLALRFSFRLGPFRAGKAVYSGGLGIVMGALLVSVTLLLVAILKDLGAWRNLRLRPKTLERDRDGERGQS